MSSIFTNNTTSSSLPSTSIPGDGYANTATSIIGARLQAWSGTTWNLVRAGVTGIMTSVTGVLNTLPIARYLVTQPTLSDGYATEFQADNRGNLKVAEQWTPTAEDNVNGIINVIQKPFASSLDSLSASDNIAVAGVAVKAAAGRLYTVFGVNNNAAVRYIQIHNATSAPAETTAPLISFPVGAGEVFSFDFSLPFGKYLSTGIYICSSSTQLTKTITTSTDASIHALYM